MNPVSTKSGEDSLYRRMNLRKALRMLIAALITFPLLAPAADEPEVVFAKFHSATLTANFDEIRKYGTAEKAESPWWMPAWLDRAMLRLIAQTLPKTYTVIGKTLSSDGNRVTLRLTATQESRPGEKPETVNGMATLVKEKGEWKVDEEVWGGQ